MQKRTVEGLGMWWP